MNEGAARYDDGVAASRTLVDLLRWRARNEPDRIVFTFLLDGETKEAHITYQELDTQARAIAALANDRNTPGEFALLLYPPSLDFIAAFYGCLYAGVVPFSINPSQLRLHQGSTLPLTELLETTRARLVMTSGTIYSKLRQVFEKELWLQGLHWLVTDDLDPEHADSWLGPELQDDSLAYLQYTSGATGGSKAVALSHRNVLHNAALIAEAFEFTPDSRCVMWLPPYHDMGLVGGIIEPLYAGMRTVLLSPLAFLQRPCRWLQAVSRYQATFSGGPNFSYDLCVRKITPEQKATLDLHSWKLAFNGAETVHAQTLEKFAETFAEHGFRRESLYPCYGLAEATLFVAGGRRETGFRVRHLDRHQMQRRRIRRTREGEEHDVEKSYTVVGCGQPWGGQKVIIVDPETRTLCDSTQIGEIWLSGDSVAKGYWNRPRETCYAFQAFLADTGEGPFLRTGDLGFLEEDQLFISGRLKDLIIIRGRNHYPDDIERTVAQSHPALRSDLAVAFGLEMDGEERLIIAQGVERKFIQVLDIGEVLRNICEAVTSQHGLRAQAIMLVKPKDIPKTSSGKLRRDAFRANFVERTLAPIACWENS